MKVGFTGTQQGMTPFQLTDFEGWVLGREISEFHHGDCIGADEQAVMIVRTVQPNAKLVCHPPVNESKRAFAESDVYLPPKEYLDRNHDIVDAVHQMVACPKGKHEEQRSGTWATIRYASKRGGLLYIIWPY